MESNPNEGARKDNSPGGKGQHEAGGGAAGGGDLPEREWMKGLPEPLKESRTLRKFSDGKHVEELAKSYVELEGKLGRAVSIPASDAPAEEWEQFYSRIGRPVSPDDYDLPKDKLDRELADRVRKAAHAAGASKRQLSALMDAVVGFSEDTVKRSQAARERSAAEAAKALKEEFGDKYPEQMKAFDVGVKSLYTESVESRLRDAGILDEPEFVRAMIRYGSKFGETVLRRGAPAAEAAKDPYDWMRERYGKRS